MDRIDFRSDTVSWPTPEMREAMANAVVGDDVYGEDPTVNELEALAAEKTGMEAALFVASGTMGNLLGILSHAGRGDAAIVGKDAHTYRYEAGGMAVLGGIMPTVLPTDEFGRMDLERVETAVSPQDPHFPITRLILVENSYGSKHGYPLPPSYFSDMKTIADRHGLALHMDGARLFNAAVAQGIDARQITQHVDSVSICLSKGLCAPVGSVLCGSKELIAKAHRNRKLVGGGMRQAGILAAAGLISLTTMVDRLHEDHEHAHMLAQGLAQIPGVVIDPQNVKTNLVFFHISEAVDITAVEIGDQMREKANIWAGDTGQKSFRAVTHYWIGEDEVQLYLDTLRHILERTIL
ncbi:MAG: low-specificity L-threonine aldolase [Anaerolineae bacterium]|nr:low-specificity L-threonine aldolase [Anaerolineae bacterium]